MPRRARLAFIGAGAGVVLLALLWFCAFHVGVVRRADATILDGFLGLSRPRLDRLTSFIAGLCNPGPYVLLAALPVAVALARGRPRVAATLGLILLGANETTELLKPLLAAPRDPTTIQVMAASWPSGHATAAMSLCMCWVIAVPARRRPAVATAMAAFAVAVCYSFLELGWHYPSDVLGGFLVATVWTLVGIGLLSVYEHHRPQVRVESARRLTVVQALGPPATLLACAALLALPVLAVHAHQVVDYGRVHTSFVVGAAAIAALGFSLAVAMTLMLSGSGPAPTAAHRRRWRHG